MRMNNFPLAVQTRLKDFSATERKAYFEEYKRRKKSLFFAYLLLLFMGWHYAYLKKWGLQTLAFLTLWGFLIWYIIDWFRLPSLVINYNKIMAVNLLQDFSWVSKKKEAKTEQGNELKEWFTMNPNKSLNDYYQRKNKI